MKKLLGFSWRHDGPLIIEEGEIGIALPENVPVVIKSKRFVRDPEQIRAFFGR